MANNILLAWIGKTDLQASVGDPKVGSGPIAQATDSRTFDAVDLLSNYSEEESKRFVNWLSKRSSSQVRLHRVQISSPIHFGDIYQRVTEVLRGLRGSGNKLTYHLSPGTGAMQAVWILLAKTTFPATLIQSSKEAGVEEAEIPFDISAEFIPQLLLRTDDRLAALAQGTASENAEFGNIVHRSLVMKRVIAQAHRIALRSIPVLIEGESGTGKELMARAIHRASPRSENPFIAVNCGAIPPELVESEFFGHKKGAFTGAQGDRKGHFERADGGTIFLDEVGELPKQVQVKLLRTLQESEVTPVGSSDSKKIDVRVIAATNRVLINEVLDGRFREDLFYRLAVAVIKLPPLREREGDVSLLIERLLKQVNDAGLSMGIEQKKLSVPARNIMLQHTWPGNVRELLNTLQRASVWSDDETIDANAMKDAILNIPNRGVGDDSIMDRPIEGGIELKGLMAEVARHYIKRAMQFTQNNKTQTANLLGFSNYQTLSNWIKRYGIDE